MSGRDLRREDAALQRVILDGPIVSPFEKRRSSPVGPLVLAHSVVHDEQVRSAVAVVPIAKRENSRRDKVWSSFFIIGLQ